MKGFGKFYVIIDKIVFVISFDFFKLYKSSAVDFSLKVLFIIF